MKVTVHCLVPRAVPAPPDADLTVPSGATAAYAALALGIAPEEVAVFLVNGAAAGPETSLAPGDRLSLIPPISGG